MTHGTIRRVITQNTYRRHSYRVPIMPNGHHGLSECLPAFHSNDSKGCAYTTELMRYDER